MLRPSCASSRVAASASPAGSIRAALAFNCCEYCSTCSRSRSTRGKPCVSCRTNSVPLTAVQLNGDKFTSKHVDKLCCSKQCHGNKQDLHWQTAAKQSLTRAAKSSLCCSSWSQSGGAAIAGKGVAQNCQACTCCDMSVANPLSGNYKHNSTVLSVPQKLAAVREACSGCGSWWLI